MIPYFKCRYFNNRSSSNHTIILKFIKGGKISFEFVLPITISCKHGLLQLDFNIELSIQYSIYTIRNYLFKFRFKFINIFNNITRNLYLRRMSISLHNFALFVFPFSLNHDHNKVSLCWSIIVLLVLVWEGISLLSNFKLITSSVFVMLIRCGILRYLNFKARYEHFNVVMGTLHTHNS